MILIRNPFPVKKKKNSNPSHFFDFCPFEESLHQVCICILFVDKNECLIEGLCENGGTCVDTQGSYKCKCILGWGGQNCEKGKFIKKGGHILDCLNFLHKKSSE